MLNIFPDLLIFGLLAPFILRIIVGIIFVHTGVTSMQNNTEYNILKWKATPPQIIPILKIICGGFLVLGLYTQATAIILIFITSGTMYTKIRRPKDIKKSLEFFILLLAILLSLIFLGAGFLAFDLPL